MFQFFLKTVNFSEFVEAKNKLIKTLRNVCDIHIHYHHIFKLILFTAAFHLKLSTENGKELIKFWSHSRSCPIHYQFPPTDFKSCLVRLSTGLPFTKMLFNFPDITYRFSKLMTETFDIWIVHDEYLLMPPCSVRFSCSSP